MGRGCLGGWAGVCLSSVAAVASGQNHTITLQPNQTYQTIDGWGTASSSSGSSDPAVEAQWRKDYRDLGLNILRFGMDKGVLVDPSGDMTKPVPLTTNLAADIGKMNFGVMSTTGSMAQWLSQNALEPSRVKIEGDVWSPPHWMKGPTGASVSFVGNPSSDSPAFPTPWLSNQYNHWYNGPDPAHPHFLGNNGASIGGRLMTEDPAILQQYGLYLAAWVKGFQQHFGVPIYAMSLQNESTFENPFDSMVLDVGPNGQADYTQYARALKSVRTAWQANGLSTRIIGPHVGNVGPTPDGPWGLLAQMKMIQGVKTDSDPTLINFLKYYGSNYYMGTDATSVQAIAGYYHGSAAVPANWAPWTYAPGVARDGKGIWYSETGDGSGNWLDAPNNPGTGAITVALKMHNALVYSNASAYVYWQMTDGPVEDSASLLGLDHVSDPALSKKYDAFRQFSRYIRPGAQRIGAVFENGQTSVGGSSSYDSLHALDVSAYLDQADRTVTVVLLNMESTGAPVTLKIPSGLDVNAFEAFQTSQTDNFQQLADLTAVNGAIQLNVPAYSVTTLTADIVPEPATIVWAIAPLLALRRRPHV